MSAEEVRLADDVEAELGVGLECGGVGDGGGDVYGCVDARDELAEHKCGKTATATVERDDDARQLDLRAVANTPDVEVVELVFGNDRNGTDHGVVFDENVEVVGLEVVVELKTSRVLIAPDAKGRAENAFVESQNALELVGARRAKCWFRHFLFPQLLVFISDFTGELQSDQKRF